jgi:hypothetical protein
MACRALGDDASDAGGPGEIDVRTAG